MKTQRKIVLAVAIIAALGIACGGEEPAGGEAAAVDVFKAAFVPDADFVARVDVQAITATPACKDFADLDEDAEEPKDEEAAAAAEKASLELEELQRITGLTSADIVTVLVSADIDALDLAGEADLEKANGVLAVQLAKALPPAKLTEALKAATKDSEETTLEEIQVAGKPAVKITSSKPKEPTLYIASGPGEMVVFVGPNSASLEGALQRAESGQFVALPAALESIRGTLPAGAQSKIAFLAPAKLREGIQEQLTKAKEDPEAAMFAGMVEPFKDLQSLAIGVECGEDLKIGIGSDLGNEQGANQVAMMLQTMVLPMAKGQIAKQIGVQPQELDDRFEVGAEGTALKIGIRLSKDDLAAIEAAEEKAESEAAE